MTPGKTVSVYEDDFTEESYRDPPADVEEELYAGWRALPPRVACRATFWAAVTLRHVDQGRIDSSYLAGDGSSKTGSTGAQRIDYVLAKPEPEADRRLCAHRHAQPERTPGGPGGIAACTLIVHSPARGGANAWSRAFSATETPCRTRQ